LTSGSGRPSVVVVHEHYQQFGGEDVAVEADVALLKSHGHRVSLYERSNDEIHEMGPLGRVQLAVGTVWSAKSRRELANVLDEHRPDVVHVHNTFPLISPAVYRAATERGIPVVQSIHNYRLVCSTGALRRDGRACMDCVGKKVPLAGVRHACYRNSRAQSLVVAAMQATHQAIRTFDRHVDLFLPVSEHVRRRLVEVGAFRADRSTVRRNHLSPDPGIRPAGADRGYAIFAGRLAAEKGVDVLIRAAAEVPDLPVRVVGDGPERKSLERLAVEIGASNVTFLGRLPRPQVLEEVAGARCFVLTSTWEEPMGLVLIEAAALGVPIIGTNLGGTPEAVNAETGELVPAGDPSSLARVLKDALGDPEKWWHRGQAARRHFETEFSAERAYATLLSAYERVLRSRPPD
jgi:glycosyltransferase involved in cell wall biosynthesis